MFVDVTIADKKPSALIETCASKLFMSKQATKKLNLCVEKENGWIKTVNSKEEPIPGIKKGLSQLDISSTWRLER
ncbi:hypothetical protein GQ457_03G012680 [Hibiscus cannabinus]